MLREGESRCENEGGKRGRGRRSFESIVLRCLMEGSLMERSMSEER